MNYLLIGGLELYDHFYGDKLTIECPTLSGNHMRLRDVALELSRRVVSLFLPNENGRRPCHGDDERYAKNGLTQEPKHKLWHLFNVCQLSSANLPY